MSKNTVVLITENGGRVLVNPPDFESYTHCPEAGVFVNPSLKDVKAISPSYWKVDGDRIGICTEEERLKREKLASRLDRNPEKMTPVSALLDEQRRKYEALAAIAEEKHGIAYKALQKSLERAFFEQKQAEKRGFYASIAAFGLGVLIGAGGIIAGISYSLH